MGEEGKHARFSLHSGAHRALGISFGRSSFGVGEDDLVDVAVRLEVNRWNGAVEPRVVLREVYRRAEEKESAEAEQWWQRFEDELARDPAQDGDISQRDEVGPGRTVLVSRNAPAAVVNELAACGESVLALCADAELRAAMACEGLRLADYAELERTPALAAEFVHVVLVDPPSSPWLAQLASRPHPDGGYTHRVWGDAEWRLAAKLLAEQLPQREALIAIFRDLRDLDEVGGEELRSALRGKGPHPRSAEAAARCFRVLAELGLVQGSPDGGSGEVGVVSSDGTDLERSASYRAYDARYQEACKFLEGQRQP